MAHSSPAALPLTVGESARLAGLQGGTQPPPAATREYEPARREDLACPVCFETLTDPFVTACGHSFCYSCISRHLEHAKSCPSCSHYLTTDLIHPNFLLSKIARRVRFHAAERAPAPLELLQQVVAEHASALREADVDTLLHQLWEVKQALQERQREASMELLMHFLQSSRQDKAQRLAQLQKELMCLEGDIQRVEAVGVGPGAQANSQQGRPATPAARPSSASGDASAAPRPSSPPAPVPQNGVHEEGQQVEQADGQQHASQQAQQQQQAQQHGGMPHPGAPPDPSAVATAAAAGVSALKQQQLVQQQHTMQQARLGQQHQQQHQQTTQQQVADFAGAAFGSGAAQPVGAPAAGAGGGVPPQPMLLPHHAAAAQGGQGHAAHAAYSGLSGSLLGPGPSTTSSGGGGNSTGGRPRDVLSLLRNKKRRIATQFDDLQQCYLQLRARQLQAQQQAAAAAGGSGSGGGDGLVPVDAAATNEGTLVAAATAALGAAGVEGAAVGPVIDEGLQEFSRLLSVITRCNKLKLVAEVPRPTPRGRGGSASIVSSLEFDREGALFATAGVSKRISVFDFAGVAPHYPAVTAPPLPGGAAAVRSGACPVVELTSRSKLSCLSWNKYIQAHIASSDYEGVVSVWDVSAAALLHEYEAHSKRIWSVDFCGADPTLLASGSDDCAVKFWSTKSPSSVAQVDTAANVCAVRWRPGSSHELAVGSADHSVYLYDMRNTSAPVCTYQGHRKAVSYVRFCNHGELVSASTDSTLRLWGVDTTGEAPAVPDSDAGAAGSVAPHRQQAQRVFEGHANEKNFVGLAVEGDFLACGSETSELFVYYKSLSKPVAQQAFAAHGEDGSDAQSDKGFISAVCWRPGAQTLLAANSQGTVRVFSLAGSSGQN